MRNPKDRLADILFSIESIRQQVTGLDEAGFSARFVSDQSFADALSFRFLIIGEATAALRIDPDWAARLKNHPQVDWAGYIGMRNILTHQYFRRDAAAIWAAIETEMPQLEAAVRILNQSL